MVFEDSLSVLCSKIWIVQWFTSAKRKSCSYGVIATTVF